MSEKKKPLPMDQIGNGKGDQIVLEEFSIYMQKSTTHCRKPQEISTLLLRGSANAISLQQLQMLTGLGGRVIRRLIQRERQSGMCICANNRSGYFLAESEAERNACARSMYARAREVEQTAQAIAAAEVAGDG